LGDNMYALDTWLAAAHIVFQWQNILLIIGISLFGLVVGFLPGIGPLTAMPLFLPVTYGMSPGPALILLAVLYMSTTYGGSISAILLNTPGTAASAATCLDGYPMAKKGKGGTAIGISMMSSFIGGFVGLAGLIFLSPLISEFSMRFQPAEYFMLAVLGLILISASTRGALLKALIAGGLGVITSSVGMDIMTGYTRFNFGSGYLRGGIPFVPLIIGLFAFSEILALIERGERTIAEKGELSGSIFKGLKEPFRYTKTLIRSSLIGLGIGTIPGEGAAVANFTAYLAEARSSKNTKEFGTGIPQGVIAPEASNNACVAGALIPTLTLGIPGGGVAAIFLGGVMVHGLNPGFELFTRHQDILCTLFFGLVVANFLILLCGTLLCKFAAKVTVLPVKILAPTIIVLGVISTYVMRSQVLDVIVAIIAGLVGFYMKKYGYSPISFLVAFILSPIAEKSFYQALLLSDDSYLTFITRPISGAFFLIILLVLFWSPIGKWLNQRKTDAKDKE